MLRYQRTSESRFLKLVARIATTAGIAVCLGLVGSAMLASASAQAAVYRTSSPYWGTGSTIVNIDTYTHTIKLRASVTADGQAPQDLRAEFCIRRYGGNWACGLSPIRTAFSNGYASTVVFPDSVAVTPGWYKAYVYYGWYTIYGWQWLGEFVPSTAWFYV